GGVAAGDALGVGREARQVAIPPRGQLAPLHLVDLVCKFQKLATVGDKHRLPVTMSIAAPRTYARLELLLDPVGNQKLGILRPAVSVLDQPDLLLAQGLAMGRGRIDLVRRAIADVAVQNDQRGSTFGLAEDGKRILDALEVVGITNPQDVPVIAEESRRDVLGEGDTRFAFDGDVVVVIDPAEVVEAEMAGQRPGLPADA